MIFPLKISGTTRCKFFEMIIVINRSVIFVIFEYVIYYRVASPITEIIFKIAISQFLHHAAAVRGIPQSRQSRMMEIGHLKPNLEIRRMGHVYSNSVYFPFLVKKE